MNKNIINKFDSIILIIKSSDEYKKYCTLKKRILLDNDIMKLINEIKINQKELVKLKSLNKNYEEQEKIINSNLDRLSTYPIYVEFNYIQEDLNELFQQIRLTIEKYIINDLIN